MITDFLEMGINQHLKQTKPFEDEVLKFIVNIHYSSSWLASHQNKLLKPIDITIQQYNILRILRGCRDRSVNQKYIKDRMIDHSSDISRLLSKMKKKKFIKSEALESDRRNKAIYITQHGLDTLKEADALMDGIRDKIKLEEGKLQLFNDLLDQLHG